MSDANGQNQARPINELVRHIMTERRLSVAEVAEFIDRDPRMARKLLNGESKGESFRQALEELDTTGTVTKPPERRKAKDGHLVPVRAKADDTTPKRYDPKTGRELAPVKTPEAPKEGRYADKVPEKYRNRKWVTKNGDKRLRVAMPPGDKKAVETGMTALHKQVQGVARSQAHKNKQIKIDVTLANGRQMSIFGKGGLNASNVLRRVNSEFGGSMDAFIRAQVGKIYPPGGAGAHQFSVVSVQSFDAKKPKRR